MDTRSAMKKVFRQAVLWIGSAIIATLAVPASVLIAMIYGVSALVDRLVAEDDRRFCDL